MSTNPVIIIGAPRSGTNMLRDVLTEIPGYVTWPCDEINLLWRHGNRSYPSDEIPANRATPRVQRYLRRQFDKLIDEKAPATAVEKTCANSLRVDFVDRCFPDARYLYITRDGIDAAASAAERWNAPLDVRYTAAKVRYVPPSDLPYYGTRFVSQRLKRRGRRETTDAVAGWWGPRLDNQEELRHRHGLVELGALQWDRCVRASNDSFSRIDPERVHRVSYESFVRRPREQFDDILAFLGERPGLGDVEGVNDRSVGKGRASLSARKVHHLEELVDPTLKELGYV